MGLSHCDTSKCLPWRRPIRTCEDMKITRTKHMYMNICTFCICRFLSCKKSWKTIGSFCHSQHHNDSGWMWWQLQHVRKHLPFHCVFWLAIQKLTSSKKFLILDELFLWHQTFSASIYKLLNDSLILIFKCSHKPKALWSSCPTKSNDL